MAQLLRFREYVEAANRARQRARNPHAKQVLQEIERSYHRLVEFEKWAVDRKPFAHFGLFNGR